MPRVWDCRAAVQPTATGLADREVPPREPAPAGSRFAAAGYDSDDPEHRATFDALEGLEEIAAAKGASLSQLALAWLSAQPGVTAPILGPRNLDQLHDNLGALEVTITAEDCATIDTIVAPAVNLA